MSETESSSRDEPASPDAGAKLRGRFGDLHRHGLDGLAQWIAHRSVREVIERRHDDAERAVAPVGRQLTDQVQTIAFCFHLFGVGAVNPDWTVDKPERWMLTRSSWP